VSALPSWGCCTSCTTSACRTPRGPARTGCPRCRVQASGCGQRRHLAQPVGASLAPCKQPQACAGSCAAQCLHETCTRPERLQQTAKFHGCAASWRTWRCSCVTATASSPPANSPPPPPPPVGSGTSSWSAFPPSPPSGSAAAQADVQLCMCEQHACSSASGKLHCFLQDSWAVAQQPGARTAAHEAVEAYMYHPGQWGYHLCHTTSWKSEGSQQCSRGPGLRWD